MRGSVKNKIIIKIVETSAIAALYVVLTSISSAFGLSYAGVQFRFSEALTILPVFSPFAITGLTLGCFISNLASPLGIIDIVFGTLSTFISAHLTRRLSKITFKGIPFLSPLPPVLLGAFVVGAMLAYLAPEAERMYVFFMSAVTVGAGQFVVCYGLGIPLFLFLRNSKIIKNIEF